MARTKGRGGGEPAPRVAVVVSRYNASITDALMRGAERACRARTGAPPHVIEAPGAFELPILCLGAAESGKFDGVVALGCLIRGETVHDRVIADSVASGLIRVSLATGVPVAFGVLTVATPAQARARAGGKHGNKGEQAMDAVLDTIASLRGFPGGVPARVSRRPDKAGGRR